MKRIFTSIALILICAIVIAQSPSVFKYQAVVHDNQGGIISNQPVTIKAYFLQDSVTGAVNYVETHSADANSFGIVNLELGNGSPDLGTFSAIDWANSAQFLMLEIDVNNTGAWEFMGTTPILSVPYAIHAETVTHNDDADADPSNELQTVSVSGGTVTLSLNGGAFSIEDADADPSNELQQLSVNGNQISLSQNGGSVSVPVEWFSINNIPTDLLDGDNVNDADSDPTNELQGLQLSGTTLTISPTGQSSVNLSGISGGISQISGGSGINVSGGTGPNTTVSVANGGISTSHLNFTPVQNPHNDDLTINGHLEIGNSGFSVDNGDLAIEDDLKVADRTELADGRVQVIRNTGENAGDLYVHGSSQSITNIRLSNSANASNAGYISVHENNAETGAMFSSPGYGGVVRVKNASGSPTVTLVGSNGLVLGNTKSFIVDHPKDDTKSIVYACIEGPEAAAYIRGTTKLSAGQAEILFPEHFELIIDPATITAQVTPLSGASKGLFVSKKSKSSIIVKELNNGTGNYEIDYYIQAKRMEHTDWKPVREKSEILNYIGPADSQSNE